MAGAEAVRPFDLARHTLAAKEKVRAIEAVGHSREDPFSKEEVVAAAESVSTMTHRPPLIRHT